MTPFQIAPDIVDNVWDLIEPGLRSVKQTDSNVEWTIDSVHDALKAGNATAVFGMKDGLPVGFFAGYPQPDKAFFVWIAYLRAGYDLGEGIQMLEDFAKCIGCTRLIFGTNRRGWERVARRYGFRPSYWEKDI